MSPRYELGTAADTACEVVAPDNPGHTIWDHQRPPAPGVRALVIGNPWASAYAVLGTPAELEQFVTRQLASLHQAPGRRRHAGPAVTCQPGLLARWLATHADRLGLAGQYTPQDSIASRLGRLLFELRWQPRIWRTAPQVGRITVYPAAPPALGEADPAEFGAVLTIEVGPVRLATDHLPDRDLAGLGRDGAEPASLPWPQAAQRAITAAAGAVNDLLARWQAATSAYATGGQPTPEAAPPGSDHHTG
jgi:hypothetical protein